MTSVDAILFDLDDTLYEERGYVLSGLKAAASPLAQLVSRPETEIYALLLDLFRDGGRDRIFNRALGHLGQAQSPQIVDDLVAAYRGHRPVIDFYPGVAAMLDRLRHSHRLAVVTDGLGQMQRAKADALGLARRVDHIVYTWEIGHPKPSPEGFVAALERMGIPPGRAVIVGDNPSHDLAAAAKIGMRAVRVRSGRFAGHPNPPETDVVLDTGGVLGLESWLAGADRQDGGQ